MRKWVPILTLHLSYLFIYPLMHLFILINSYTHSFVHSYSYSFIHSYIFIHSYTQSFICTLIHSFVHSFIHSFIHCLPLFFNPAFRSRESCTLPLGLYVHSSLMQQLLRPLWEAGTRETQTSKMTAPDSRRPWSGGESRETFRESVSMAERDARTTWLCSRAIQSRGLHAKEPEAWWQHSESPKMCDFRMQSLWHTCSH